MRVTSRRHGRDWGRRSRSRAIAAGGTARVLSSGVKTRAAISTFAVVVWSAPASTPRSLPTRSQQLTGSVRDAKAAAHVACTQDREPRRCDKEGASAPARRMETENKGLGIKREAARLKDEAEHYLDVTATKRRPSESFQDVQQPAIRISPQLYY